MYCGINRIINKLQWYFFEEKKVTFIVMKLDFLLKSNVVFPNKNNNLIKNV